MRACVVLALLGGFLTNCEFDQVLAEHDHNSQPAGKHRSLQVRSGSISSPWFTLVVAFASVFAGNERVWLGYALIPLLSHYSITIPSLAMLYN